MFFSLESAQSPALCTVPATKTSTVGLNLPFSKISPASFEQNKAFCILVAKMIQEGEPQGIKSPQLFSHCNLESISQSSVNRRDHPMALSCVIFFSEHSWGIIWEQRWMFMPFSLPICRAGSTVGFLPLSVIKDYCNISVVFWFSLWTSNISMIFIMTFDNEQGEYTEIRNVSF